MRKILLTVVMACLVCMPVLAQFRMFGGRGDMGALLLGKAEVQKELKLTDEQKKAIETATKERTEAIEKAKEDMDRAAFQKAGEAYTKAMRKVQETLKPDQKKRLLGIQVQASEKMNVVSIFKNADVAKTLKLTEKQKDIVADYEKDMKDLYEDAKGDRKNDRAAFKKMGTMSKESFAKLTKTFSDEQKSAWKDLKGETFDLKLPTGGLRPKGGKREKPKPDE